MENVLPPPKMSTLSDAPPPGCLYFEASALQRRWLASSEAQTAGCAPLAPLLHWPAANDGGGAMRGVD